AWSSVMGAATWVFSRTTRGPSPCTSSEPIFLVGTASVSSCEEFAPVPFRVAAPGTWSGTSAAEILRAPRREKRLSCCLRSRASSRSEEHTSELQSRENLVCRLLLEKKKEYSIRHGIDQ